MHKSPHLSYVSFRSLTLALSLPPCCVLDFCLLSHLEIELAPKRDTVVIRSFCLTPAQFGSLFISISISKMAIYHKHLACYNTLTCTMLLCGRKALTHSLCVHSRKNIHAFAFCYGIFFRSFFFSHSFPRVMSCAHMSINENKSLV